MPSIRCPVGSMIVKGVTESVINLVVEAVVKSFTRGSCETQKIAAVRQRASAEAAANELITRGSPPIDYYYYYYNVVSELEYKVNNLV